MLDVIVFLQTKLHKQSVLLATFSTSLITTESIKTIQGNLKRFFDKEEMLEIKPVAVAAATAPRHAYSPFNDLPVQKVIHVDLDWHPFTYFTCSEAIAEAGHLELIFLSCPYLSFLRKKKSWS